MAYTVQVELNHTEINAFLYTNAGPIVRGVRRLGQQVQRVAIRRVPVDTGKLAASITVITNVAPGFVFSDIGSGLDYAIWRHEGTGIYGSGRPIRPRSARALRFKAGRKSGSNAARARYRASPYVYAQSVKGTKGKPFLVEALIAVMGAHARIRRSKRGR